MRIAFVFNVSHGGGEEEAEFDTPATVDYVSGLLRGLGHDLEPIDAALPLPELVLRLTAVRADVVVSTAEGRTGRFREAFFPALYEELGLPYTGSGAWTCAVTLDKWISKLVARAAGARTPDARLVRTLADLDLSALVGPLIVKPNFEGSSKGIDRSSVVTEPGELREVVTAELERFPEGVLVEEFVAGRDVSVALLEPHGVLAAVEYAFADPDAFIYDFERKNARPDDVQVRAPATLTTDQESELARVAGDLFGAFAVRDLGRGDFRVADDGSLWFLEVNPLPSLEEGAGIYAAAELAGLGPDGVLSANVHSAAARSRLEVAK